MKFRLLLVLLIFSILFTVIVYQIIKPNITTEQALQDEIIDVYWSYEGISGPDYWSSIDASYEACGKGKKQSPINIDQQNLKETNSLIMKIQYGMDDFTIKEKPHTLEVVSKTKNSSILINEKEYKLDSFHFHTPSEHQVGGKAFDMEFHFVHQSEDGNLAVMTVFANAGEENALLKEIWDIYNSSEKEIKNIELINFLPSKKEAYNYIGSLTTPPCTEGVQWIIFEEPIELSETQIAAFKNLFGHNNRPIQPLNDRENLKITVN